MIFHAHIFVLCHINDQLSNSASLHLAFTHIYAGQIVPTFSAVRLEERMRRKLSSVDVFN